MRLEDINLRDPVKIACYDPFSVYPVIQEDFSSKFPLSNLHWKYHPLKPGKSIPLLPVELTEEVPPLLQKPKPKNTISKLDNVYLRLMFVRADNLDMYRSQVRPLINAWLEFLIKGGDVTWAIILVSPGSKKDKPSTLIKTSVYDKLKMDFGRSGKQLAILGMADLADDSSAEDAIGSEKDNIFKIKDAYPDDMLKLQGYNEVINQCKCLLLQTFDRRYNSYNDHIELLLKLANTDSEAGVSVFIYKMRLYHLMSDMKFLSESLDLFDELYDDFKSLLSSNDYLFDKKSSFLLKDLQLNDFSPEVTFHLKELFVQFTNYVHESIPVNAFAAKLGLFLSASMLLQSLANFATSISVSSIYVLTLLQKLSFFIHDISANYPDTLQLNEWFCAMIDFYLSLPLTEKLIELTEESQDNGAAANIASIQESTAELMLLRRTITGNLAVKKGLDLPLISLILEDISIDDHKVNEKYFELKYKPLIEELGSQESYEKFFEQTTIAAIEGMLASNRSKTIDLLSVDLAALHFKKKQYEEALEILLTSHDYFIENGWNFMGGALLEIHLECIKKVSSYSHEDILKTYLKLLTTLKNNYNAKCGINNYNLVKDKIQRHAVFDEIRKEAASLDSAFEYPIADIFCVSVDNFVHTKPQSNDDYSINVKLGNPFAIDIKLQKLKVTLTLTEQDEELVFTRSNVEISAKPHHVLALHSRIFRKGTYRVKEIEIQVSEMLLLKQGTKDVSEFEIDQTVIRLQEDREVEYEHEKLHFSSANDTSLIGIYPVPGKFWVETVSPELIELGVAKFDLIIHNGHRKANNVRVSLASLTSGVKFDNDEPNFEIGQIDAEKLSRRGITFSYFGDAKILDVNIDVVYEVEGLLYEYHASEAYDMSLKISISVQDIFRTNSFYPKFQIGSAVEKVPVRVLDCEFASPDEKYEISKLTITLNENDLLIVMGEQPAFMFFKVQPKLGISSSKDILNLTITYSDLHFECCEIAKTFLFNSLAKFDLSKYYFIMVSTLADLNFNLHHYAVYKEIEVTNIETVSLMMNNVVSKFIPNSDAERLMGIVRELFLGPIKIGDPAAYFQKQRLYIPVAIPLLGMYHQVDLVFERKQRYLVGESIKTTLEIKSTSKWSSEEPDSILASSSPTRTSDIHTPLANEPSEFQFAFLNEDQWLITGFKKHQFAVDQNSVATFDVCLIPLNVGELQLPKLSIKSVGGASLGMETVLEYALETVLVVPELDSLTFSF